MRSFPVVGLAAVVGISAQAQALDPALVNTRWRVLEISGQPARHAETLGFTQSKVLGRSACNYVSAGVKQNGETLELGRSTVTVMPCAKHKSADERRYLEAFGAIRGYTMTGEGLLLTGVGGRTLFRLAR